MIRYLTVTAIAAALLGASCSPAVNPLTVRKRGWTKLEAAPSIKGKQDDVYFLDEERGFSVNGLGQIFRTKDGGASWDKLIDQPGTYFRAITFVTDTHGFAGNIGTDYFPGVKDPRPLFETKDGGVSWQPVTTITGPTPKGICNFNRIDATHVVAVGRVGGPSFLLKTSDAGATWTSLDLTSKLAMLIDARFTTPDEGIIVGGTSTEDDARCVILHTKDGGQTWDTRYTASQPGNMCWKLSFPSNDVGYASILDFGGQKSFFVKSTDGGKTWREMPFIEGPYEAKGVGFITPEIGWMAGDKDDKGAYRTLDGGLTWTRDRSLGPYINRFRFVNDHVGYAIGASIFKLDLR
jgi:photosystem II stability/assembly factor-like uncharacterized protein